MTDAILDLAKRMLEWALERERAAAAEVAATAPPKLIFRAPETAAAMDEKQ
jgi:hypothetical protein